MPSPAKQRRRIETIEIPDWMRGQFTIFVIDDMYIGVHKIGSARDRIRAIDNARDGIREIDDTPDKIGKHNIIRGNNRMTRKGGLLL